MTRLPFFVTPFVAIASMSSGEGISRRPLGVFEVGAEGLRLLLVGVPNVR